MLGLGLSIPQLATRGGRTLTLSQQVAALFASGEQGAWYDPSDLSTLYQDAAGTTPVTAVEQPVGRMLDKSGRGNHATQATTASRPVLSARVNLLTKTEDFADAVWGKQLLTINNVVDGGNAKEFVSQGGRAAIWHTTKVRFAGQEVINCFRVKKGTHRYVTISSANSRVGANANIAYTEPLSVVFDLQTGEFLSSPSAGYYATAVDDGWYDLYRITAASAVDTQYNSAISLALVSDTGSNTTQNGDSVLVRRAFTVQSNQSALPYQSVNTSTDYDTAGFPAYLKFDGIDDSLVTNSIDFTATDKMTVCAGVMKLSDAAQAVVAELSASAGGYTGTFLIDGPSSVPGPNYRFGTHGSLLVASAVSPAAYPAPITNVLTGIGNISGDSAILRVDGTQAASSTADQGTGNYGNHQLFIGCRAGNSLPFNGRIYSLVVCGKLASAAEITATEAYINQKTRAY